MNTFSKHWISSTKAKKQRKYRANAPLHIKKKFLGAHLSKDLRTKQKARAMVVRKGDTVKVMRGQFKGRTGKVERIFTQLEKVYIAGVETKKLDGSKSFYPVNPSNLMIIELVSTDKRRLK